MKNPSISLRMKFLLLTLNTIGFSNVLLVTEQLSAAAVVESKKMNVCKNNFILLRVDLPANELPKDLEDRIYLNIKNREYKSNLKLKDFFDYTGNYENKLISHTDFVIPEKISMEAWSKITKGYFSPADPFFDVIGLTISGFGKLIRFPVVSENRYIIRKKPCTKQKNYELLELQKQNENIKFNEDYCIYKNDLKIEKRFKKIYRTTNLPKELVEIINDYCAAM